MYIYKGSSYNVCDENTKLCLQKLPGTIPQERPLVFGKKGAERLHIIHTKDIFHKEFYKRECKLGVYLEHCKVHSFGMYFIVAPLGYNVYLQ